MTGFESKREAAAGKLQEPVADRLERLLWEYIDLQAAHPEHKPDPKTWHHLMTYAPQPAQEPAYLDMNSFEIEELLQDQSREFMRNH